MTLRRLKNRLLSLANVGESICRIHDLLTDIRTDDLAQHRRLHRLEEAVSSLVQKPIRGSVLLLWESKTTGDTFVDGIDLAPPSPCIASITVDLSDGYSKEETLDLNGVFVPTGAWLVAVGCRVSQVIVGLECMSIPTVSPPGVVCRLSKAVFPGVHVRFLVWPP